MWQNSNTIITNQNYIPAEINLRNAFYYSVMQVWNLVSHSMEWA